MRLLLEYAAGNSEEAFKALVARHINLVYSVALRVLRDSHQAEDVAQSVFLLLARKARSIDSGTVVSGWLYHTARLTACNFLRAESRRRQREQQAQMQSTINDPGPDLWPLVAPLLEEAMATLNEKDRDAVVLRYFEGRKLKEVGDALGVTEDAAKMRVSRALDKLRGFLVERGIAVPEALLAAALAENCVAAAPAGLAATVATGVLQTTASAAIPLTLKGALYIMSTAKISAVIGITAAAIIAYQWHQVSTERQNIDQLQKQATADAQTARAQAQEIQSLKEQMAAKDKSMEAIVRDAAKSRANATAARTANQLAEAARKSSGNGNNANGNPLAAMFKDPDVLKAMKEQQASMMKIQYGPLVKQLHLSDDQANKFYQILIGKSAENLDAMQSGNLSSVMTNAAASQKTMENDLKSVLGEDGYSQYKDFTGSMADRMMLDMTKNNFADNPLSDQQQQQLLDAMKSARKNIAATAPAPDLSNQGDRIAAMSQALDQQQLVNQSVLQQAASFLSPDQLQTLSTSQSNWMSMQKVGIAMAQKMFTNGPGQGP
jgi:RNA polymerase sigma factor (sigma-70 family)